jgi:hypothetical protein
LHRSLRDAKTSDPQPSVSVTIAVTVRLAVIGGHGEWAGFCGLSHLGVQGRKQLICLQKCRAQVHWIVFIAMYKCISLPKDSVKLC